MHTYEKNQAHTLDKNPHAATTMFISRIKDKAKDSY